MINRLLIRIKVLQVLYNYYQVKGMGIPGAIGLLRYALEQSYQLYIYLTGLPYDLKEAAEFRLLKEEEKFNKDAQTIRLLKHIINNPITQIIGSDDDYLAEREPAKVTTHGIDSFINNLLNKLIERRGEKTSIDWKDLSEVRKAWRNFYGEEILQSDLFTELLEDSNTFRNDDIAIIFTFVTKAYNSISDEKPYSKHLKPQYSSEEDEDFGPVLLEQAIVHGDEYRERISKYFKNWDKERVSEMDYIIMQLAVTEAIHFPQIATRVTINEYLNMAHYYSSENSYTFINGILHELFTELKAEGKILGE
ncbi:Transcription antitermination protein NusB [Porphyromonas levii]|uniref:Transcription antitermination protein NusB n=1 Tax=Porphyromonas levii TaxID=28114 RepID=A0A4Y8WPQ5_9PORP|nr:transcription antitermination factor NusB [Porphyromonas levii]MBR8785469.1 Transcription antitermination protein NusB [Porphyromonas levii]TFH94941.1 transcription antitermination protein NusB [Porphyromonas levii]TFH95014.1 transcription antitermination protein NusB [Porphyromonas levii]